MHNYQIETREFWTGKQRQSSSLHEISYRACFKAELPRYFIEQYSNIGDIIYDPFAGRGTTGIEAALLGRVSYLNDVNPLSKILSKPRLFIPKLHDVEKRLSEISYDYSLSSDIDLSMFFHKKTLAEIMSVKNFFCSKTMDDVDQWIQMVLTNRVTGHSSGFLSVYTLPPNQAVTPNRQILINKKYNNTPEYRCLPEILLKKSKSLLRNLTDLQLRNIESVKKSCLFFTTDSGFNREINDEIVQLTITSPPFLDVINYNSDNWLRCYVNNLNLNNLNISILKKIEDWKEKMQTTLNDLYRITKRKGFVAFEVGEIRKGSIKLEDIIIPLSLAAGFSIEKVMINQQNFSKTSNIWGVKNNKLGTNTNRIILLRK